MTRAAIANLRLSDDAAVLLEPKRTETFGFQTLRSECPTARAGLRESSRPGRLKKVEAPAVSGIAGSRARAVLALVPASSHA
jgi:hypothetical protein